MFGIKLSEWVTEYKIPLGKNLNRGIEWFNERTGFIFDFVTEVIEGAIQELIMILKYPDPLIFILIVAVFIFYLRRNILQTAFVTLSLLLILNLGYWEATIETIVLVGLATFICIVVGVPLGIYAGHRPLFFNVIRPVLDLMQTIPTFVYLIPTLIFFGLGVVPGIISTVIFALPAPIRLTYLGIHNVPYQMIEAGKSFGAKPREILWKIEIPHALPSILIGISQCILLSLSMVVIAALVGADGLGKPVVRALNTVNIASGFEAGLSIVLIAIIMDRLFKSSNQNPQKN